MNGISEDAGWVMQDPYRLLALELSVPRQHGIKQRSVEAHLTVDEAHVNLRLPNNHHEKKHSPLFLDKEGYLMCCLILSRWLEVCEFGDDNFELHYLEQERILYDDCIRHISNIAKREESANDSNSSVGQYLNYWQVANNDLLKELDINTNQQTAALNRATKSLKELEARGLIIDPPFAGVEGLVILLGLIPLKFNNKTERGERITKEISAHAALWDFNYKSSKAIRGKGYERSMSVNLRGLKFIRNLTTNMAKQYINDSIGSESAPEKLESPNEQNE